MSRIEKIYEHQYDIALFLFIILGVIFFFMGSITEDLRDAMEYYTYGAAWLACMPMCAVLDLQKRTRKKILDLNLQIEELMDRVKELEKSENNRA